MKIIKSSLCFTGVLMQGFCHATYTTDELFTIAANGANTEVVVALGATFNVSLQDATNLKAVKTLFNGNVQDYLDKIEVFKKKSGGGLTQEQVNKMIKDAGIQPVSVSNKADALKELKGFFTKQNKPGKQLLEVIAEDKNTIKALEKAFNDLQ